MNKLILTLALLLPTFSQATEQPSCIQIMENFLEEMRQIENMTALIPIAQPGLLASEWQANDGSLIQSLVMWDPTVNEIHPKVDTQVDTQGTCKFSEGGDYKWMKLSLLEKGKGI